jgi:hypothetical protein
VTNQRLKLAEPEIQRKVSSQCGFGCEREIVDARQICVRRIYISRFGKFIRTYEGVTELFLLRGE